jgi:hypothetical protein
MAEREEIRRAPRTEEFPGFGAEPTSEPDFIDLGFDWGPNRRNHYQDSREQS